MTKTQEILEYHMAHPDAPARDIASNLSFSRQLVSITLKNRGLKAAPVKYEVNKPGPACKYCGGEVRSSTWDKNARKAVRCHYHNKCLWKVSKYQGECPVCGKHFERVRSQVGRSYNGHPTSGVVVCSNPCRLKAMSRGLYPQQRVGRPKKVARTT